MESLQWQRLEVSGVLLDVCGYSSIAVSYDPITDSALQTVPKNSLLPVLEWQLRLLFDVDLNFDFHPKR